ncbi:Craniofacial development protein 2 [Fasciola hepatica]|uniref:Craniofacial development protein 2 n=1 Tax=Fasciola hepatica TaxID=6192 RepID=A0A4E0RUZ7_FASHE|nr:Craniofacial development protein 2 [Fasciola hepatica]
MVFLQNVLYVFRRHARTDALTSHLQILFYFLRKLQSAVLAVVSLREVLFLLSRPPPSSIQVSPNPLLFGYALFHPRPPFKLVKFNVRTLMRIVQQVCLARALKTLTIDACCIQETRIQDARLVIRLMSPSSPVKFHLRLSGDAEAATSSLTGVGVALSERDEATLLDWIPVDSRLGAVTFRGLCRVSRHHLDRCSLFVVSTYAPKDGNADAIKDVFCQKLLDLLHKAKRGDVVILAGDLNARVGQLSSNETHLGGSFGL